MYSHLHHSVVFCQLVYEMPSKFTADNQARIQEFLVEGDDMDEEKIGRVWGPP
jgi:hypothetical protein